MNVSEDTQEMTLSRSTAFLRDHKKKDRWGTNNDKTNATDETTDTQTKKNCNRRTALERLEGIKVKKIAFGNKEHITDRKRESRFIETLRKQ